MIILRQKQFTGKTKLINKALKNLKLTEMGMKEVSQNIKNAKSLSPLYNKIIKEGVAENPLQRGRMISQFGSDKSSHLDKIITDKASDLMERRTGGNSNPKKQIKELWGKWYYHPDRKIQEKFYDNPHQKLQILKARLNG